MPRSRAAVALLVASTSLVTAVAVGTATFALSNGGLSSSASTTSTRTCPEPRRTDTAAQARRVSECESARDVEQLLLAAGARSAAATVRTVESTSLLGPGQQRVVVARVTPPAKPDSWDPEVVARAISRTVGTLVTDVTIVDDDLRPLFEPDRAEPAIGN